MLLSTTLLQAQMSLSFEAENAVIAGSHTMKIGGEYASNGEWVILKKASSNAGSATFQVEDIQEEGNYYLKIFHFNNNTAQTAFLEVNGQSSSINLNPTRWEYQGVPLSTVFEIALNAGSNTIKISAPSNTGSNILVDNIVISDSAFTTYFVSPTGDDANNGVTSNTAWKTLDKANEALKTTSNGGLLQPGDRLLFEKDAVFEGQLVVLCSGSEENPIEIGSYGTGELPIISGSGNIPTGDHFEAVKITNASHLLLNDFWVKNDRKNKGNFTWNTNSSYGIFVKADEWGGTIRNLTFRNLKVTDVFGIDMLDFEGKFTRDYYKAEGISFDARKKNSEHATTEDEIAIDDVLVENCYFYNLGTRGISVRNVGGANNPVDTENRSLNYVIRNNYFEKLGGDGVVLAAVCNALVEHNEYVDLGWGDHTSSTDLYYGRGEGCWVWDSRNLIVQYNKQLRNRGYGDTYGAGGHIDFYCKNVVFQYNYSEDTEGGFTEILGDCENSTFRFNVSVNDGYRLHNGYTLWVSGYVGTDEDPVRSDKNYIYNNTVYYDDPNCKPRISIWGLDTYVYNNVFMALNGAQIGLDQSGKVGVEVDTGTGSLFMSNNMFQDEDSGNIATAFKNLDSNPLDDEWPSFVNAGGNTKEDYQIDNWSALVNAGTSFPQPQFPMAGLGIFKDITLYPTQDFYGVSVDINNAAPNIGANNAHNSNLALGVEKFGKKETFFSLYSNPVKDILNLQLHENFTPLSIRVFELGGAKVYETALETSAKNIKLSLPNSIRNGIYVLHVSNGKKQQAIQFILYRK